jgi:hypothetical protein
MRLGPSFSISIPYPLVRVFITQPSKAAAAGRGSLVAHSHSPTQTQRPIRIFSIFSVQSSRIGLRTPPSLPAISDLRPAQLWSIFSSFVGAMPRKSASPPPPGEAAAAGATTSGKRPADQPPELTPAQKALRSNSKPARAPEDSDKKVLISLLTSHTVQFSFQILIRLPAHFSLSLSHTHTHSSHSM